MFFIPGFVIAIVTFPGVIVHEAGHLFFCKLFELQVYAVCFFRVGNPAGYVVHERTGKLTIAERLSQTFLLPGTDVNLVNAHRFTQQIFFAPLLHVYRDYWMPEVVPPPDWRDWLGYMAVLNVIGLLVYRIARNIFAHTRKNPVRRTFWEIDTRRFWLAVTFALIVSAVLQFYTYTQYGGIIGYVTTIVAWL